MDVQARHARREAQRRTVARRRRLAGSILGALALAALAVVLLASESGSSTQSALHNASSTQPGAHAHPVRSGPPRDGAPAARATGRPGTAAVPILMYHVIKAPPAGAPFPGLYVQPQEFAAQ